MNNIAPAIQPQPATQAGAPRPSFAAAFHKPEHIGPPKSILLFGNTGTRKTSMVAKLVATGRFKKMLIIDIDNGSEVLLNEPEVYQAVQEGRIEILPIDKLDPHAHLKVDSALMEIAGYRRNQLGKIEYAPDLPDYGYDAVVLDTLNGAQDVEVRHLLATTFNEKGKQDTRAAYGQVGVWTDEIARVLHNSPRFTGFMVLHAQEERDETGALTVKPKLAGSMRDSIATIPSICAYLHWKEDMEGNRTLIGRLGETSAFISKNRYMLPSVIENFDLEDVYQMIDAKYNNNIAAVDAA